MNIKNFPDYNFCVDKILQISPCYDITSKNDKGKQLLNFGFMQMANNNNRSHNNNEYGNNFGMSHHGNNIADLYFHMNNNDNNDNEIKMDGIDMNDFKQFDGDI